MVIDYGYWCRRVILAYAALSNGRQTAVGIVLGAALLLAIVALNRFTYDGTTLEHIIYLPLFVIALFVGPWWGGFIGLCCSFAVSPIFSDGSVTVGVQQWISYQYLSYMLLPMLTGVLARTVKQLVLNDDNTGQYEHELVSARLKRMLNELPTQKGRDKDDVTDIMTLRLEQLNQLKARHGEQDFNDIMAELREKLEQLLGTPSKASKVADDRFVAVSKGASFSGEDVEERLTALMKSFEERFGDFNWKGSLLRSDADALTSQWDDVVEQSQQSVYQQREGDEPFLFHDESKEADQSGADLMPDSLKEAMRAKDIELHFSPRLSTQKACYSTLDLVLRWRMKNGKYAELDAISALLTNGKTHSLFLAWVWSELTHQLSEWSNKNAGQRIRISFPVTLINRIEGNVLSLIAERAAALQSISVDIELHVSEKALARAPNKIINRLRQLKKRGLTVGVQRASEQLTTLQTLSRLPVDSLKLAQNELEALSSVSVKNSELKRFVQMAQSKGFHLVATELANKTMLSRMSEVGFDELQGSVIGEPTQLSSIPAKQLC